MERITKKRLENFISEISDKKSSSIPNDNGMCYYSKSDGSYLTRVGMEESLKYLLKRGITQEIQSSNGGKVSNIGFNPDENKWYGWSHRAIYGFTIGSECKKGDCGYMAKDKSDFISSTIEFWKDEFKDVEFLKEDTVNGESGFWVEFKYNNKVPNEKIRNSISSTFTQWPDKYGKGEWVAKTMDDAKQMAKDFAEGVS